LAYNRNLLVAQVEERLARNPRVCLVTLAKELRIDRHTIKRALSAMYGLSFRKYQKDLITKTTIRRLHETNLSGKQLAAEIGYGFSQSLSRFVRSATGKTPKQLRQEKS
jgi:AraC-like DNA-binding protein